MKRFLLAALLPVLLFASATRVEAQIPGLSLPAASSAAGAPKPPPPVVAIAIDQVLPEAEDDTSRLHEMANDLDDDETVTEIAADLSPLTRDSNNHLNDVRRTLAARPSVAAIHALEPTWVETARNANEITKELTKRAAQLTRLLGELDRMDQTWDATLKSAQATQAPQAILDRINQLSDLIGKTRTAAAARQSEVLTLQSKAVSLGSRANDTLDQLDTASQRATSQLLTRDSQPVWSGGFWSSAIAAVTTQGSESLRAQFSDLATFFTTEPEQAGLHLLLFIVLVVVMLIARKRVQSYFKDEPETAKAAEVFNAPIATAFLTACFLGYWLYTDPPQLLPRLLALLSIFPMLVVVRRLIERHLYPILYALTGFNLLELTRNIVSISAPIARLIFVVEILAGVIFLSWLYLASRPVESREWTKKRTWRILHVAAGLGLLLGVLVLIANLVGYQGLSTLVGSAMLRGAYLALLLYALTRVAQGLLLGAFHVRPLTYLSMVRQHRRLLTDRIVLFFNLAAALFWIFLMLRSVGFWQVTSKNVSDLLDADLTAGSFAISLGKILSFAIALLLANWISRLVTFVLDEEVYPNVNLARGIPYVISTMLRYAILLIGIVIGLASLGIDMTKFTILAGAFSVGLGFGMQNIVNNFVSGLIVLFERPIKVGDVVQFGDLIGRVERIGIRASIIRAGNGAEVIIPNGTLIANNVTNWTLSNKSRRVDVPIQAALAADPEQVKKLLLEVAGRFPGVSDTPAPQALMTMLGPDALTFELRIWTDAASDWASLKSDLTSAASEELRKAGIAFK